MSISTYQEYKRETAKLQQEYISKLIIEVSNKRYFSRVANISDVRCSKLCNFNVKEISKLYNKKQLKNKNFSEYNDNLLACYDTCTTKIFNSASIALSLLNEEFN